jgi:hypothetical protein
VAADDAADAPAAPAAPAPADAPAPPIFLFPSSLLLFSNFYFMDLLPRHFHFLRERLLGEFGSDFQSPFIFADLAQYESPLAVPGRILSFPSDAFPDCPNLTVFILPVSGFLNIFAKRVAITIFLLF